MATKKTDGTEVTEETNAAAEVKPTITITVDDLKALIAAEVSKAVKKAEAVTKEDLKGLIDPLGRNYKSTAVVKVAKGGKVVKQD